VYSTRLTAEVGEVDPDQCIADPDILEYSTRVGHRPCGLAASYAVDTLTPPTATKEGRPVVQQQQQVQPKEMTIRLDRLNF
jgi:hypothetical protein